jgi:adenosine deaminase
MLPRKHQRKLAELHFHLGQSVEPHILWSIAHEQGIRLPSKDYWEFCDLITLKKENVGWDDYHALFKWTELIQSSPIGIERAVYETVSGAYRVNNITLLEPSFNPMFRNRNGEQDLDQIILAAIRGMEKALIEHPIIKAGLIFILDKRLSIEKNRVIVQKAIKYKNRGILGIDMGGPNEVTPDDKDYIELYETAAEAGLKTTIHTGETKNADEMEKIVEMFPLNRINHGIKAHRSKRLMKILAEKGLTLCIAPTSNLRLKLAEDLKEYKKILRSFLDNGVKFCINTDNPSMLGTNLIKEIKLLEENDILTKKELDQTVRWAFEATFIPLKNNGNLYL